MSVGHDTPVTGLMRFPITPDDVDGLARGFANAYYAAHGTLAPNHVIIPHLIAECVNALYWQLVASKGES